jgi:hypothetical protein
MAASPSASTITSVSTTGKRTVAGDSASTSVAAREHGRVSREHPPQQGQSRPAYAATRRARCAGAARCRRAPARGPRTVAQRIRRPNPRRGQPRDVRAPSGAETAVASRASISRTRIASGTPQARPGGDRSDRWAVPTTPSVPPLSNTRRSPRPRVQTVRARALSRRWVRRSRAPKMSSWTTSRRATWPGPWHPVHRHDVGACALPIGGARCLKEANGGAPRRPITPSRTTVVSDKLCAVAPASLR